jgi:hypothetical protein
MGVRGVYLEMRHPPSLDFPVTPFLRQAAFSRPGLAWRAGATINGRREDGARNGTHRAKKRRSPHHGGGLLEHSVLGEGRYADRGHLLPLFYKRASG